MDQNIVLKGTIGTSTAALAHPNGIVGTSDIDPNTFQGWLNNTTNDQMYAGFFGNTAKDITGIFSADATSPDPLGGTRAINDDRRGYYSITGVFNGKCVSTVGTGAALVCP